MPKNLGELRLELAHRLGFGTTAGSEIVQKDILNSFLIRSQEYILSEFGSMLPGTTYPANDFEADTDYPSVPEGPLFKRALVWAKMHYRQPADAAAMEWSNFESNSRGFSS